MPTYEYICRSCRHEFDQFQPMSARPLRTCPRCGRASLERKIGLGGGVIFKGSGFYETDYRSESYKKAKEAETKSASSTDTGHKHDGVCACGKKPADQCAPSPPEKPARTARAKTKQ